MVASDGNIDWSTQIRDHNPRVLAFLRARGVPPDRVDDLAQEAWTRLITNHRRGRFDRIELPGLAIAQARFLALDEARRQTWLATRPPTDSFPDPSDLEAHLSARSGLQKVGGALEACPPRARQVFGHVMAHPAQSHLEVATALGLSVQRVRQTLCEVRRRLRKATG